MPVLDCHPTTESIDQRLDAIMLEQIEAQIEDRLAQDPNAVDPDGPSRIVGTSLEALTRLKAILEDSSAE